MKSVQFDMDGVLADFYAGYDAVCLKLGINPPAVDAPWDDRWNDAVWQRIKNSWTFWYNLPSLVGTCEFNWIERLQQKQPFYFVTNRAGIDPKGQTEAWLIRHGISNPTVVITGQKAEFAKAVGIGYSIEDKAGNAVAISYLSRNTVSVLLDRPYNQLDHSVIGGSVRRVKDLTGFLQLVQGGE